MTQDCAYVAVQSGRLWLMAVGGSERVTAVLPSEDQEGQPWQLQDQRSSLRALRGNQFMRGPLMYPPACSTCLFSLSVTRVLLIIDQIVGL